MVAARKKFDHLRPTEQESVQARKSSRVLSAYVRRTGELHIEVGENDRREVVSLPARAVQLLMDLLTQIADGNAVTLTPLRAELTTQ